MMSKHNYFSRSSDQARGVLPFEPEALTDMRSSTSMNVHSPFQGVTRCRLCHAILRELVGSPRHEVICSVSPSSDRTSMCRFHVYHHRRFAAWKTCNKYMRSMNQTDPVLSRSASDMALAENIDGGVEDVAQQYLEVIAQWTKSAQQKLRERMQSALEEQIGKIEAAWSRELQNADHELDSVAAEKRASAFLSMQDDARVVAEDLDKRSDRKLRSSQYNRAEGYCQIESCDVNAQLTFMQRIASAGSLGNKRAMEQFERSQEIKVDKLRRQMSRSLEVLEEKMEVTRTLQNLQADKNRELLSTRTKNALARLEKEQSVELRNILRVFTRHTTRVLSIWKNAKQTGMDSENGGDIETFCRLVHMKEGLIMEDGKATEIARFRTWLRDHVDVHPILLFSSIASVRDIPCVPSACQEARVTSVEFQECLKRLLYPSNTTRIFKVLDRQARGFLTEDDFYKALVPNHATHKLLLCILENTDYNVALELSHSNGFFECTSAREPSALPQIADVICRFIFEESADSLFDPRTPVAPSVHPHSSAVRSFSASSHPHGAEVRRNSLVTGGKSALSDHVSSVHRGLHVMPKTDVEKRSSFFRFQANHGAPPPKTPAQSLNVAAAKSRYRSMPRTHLYTALADHRSIPGSHERQQNPTRASSVRRGGNSILRSSSSPQLQHGVISAAAARASSASPQAQRVVVSAARASRAVDTGIAPSPSCAPRKPPLPPQRQQQQKAGAVRVKLVEDLATMLERGSAWDTEEMNWRKRNGAEQQPERRSGSDTRSKMSSAARTLWSKVKPPVDTNPGTRLMMAGIRNSRRSRSSASLDYRSAEGTAAARSRGSPKGKTAAGWSRMTTERLLPWDRKLIQAPAKPTNTTPAPAVAHRSREPTSEKKPGKLGEAAAAEPVNANMAPPAVAKGTEPGDVRRLFTSPATLDHSQSDEAPHPPHLWNDSFVKPALAQGLVSSDRRVPWAITFSKPDAVTKPPPTVADVVTTRVAPELTPRETPTVAPLHAVAAVPKNAISESGPHQNLFFSATPRQFAAAVTESIAPEMVPQEKRSFSITPLTSIATTAGTASAVAPQETRICSATPPASAAVTGGTAPAVTPQETHNFSETPPASGAVTGGTAPAVTPQETHNFSETSPASAAVTGGAASAAASQETRIFSATPPASAAVTGGTAPAVTPQETHTFSGTSPAPAAVTEGTTPGTIQPERLLFSATPPTSTVTACATAGAALVVPPQETPFSSFNVPSEYFGDGTQNMAIEAHVRANDHDARDGAALPIIAKEPADVSPVCISQPHLSTPTKTATSAYFPPAAVTADISPPLPNSNPNPIIPPPQVFHFEKGPSWPFESCAQNTSLSFRPTNDDPQPEDRQACSLQAEAPAAVVSHVTPHSNFVAQERIDANFPVAPHGTSRTPLMWARATGAGTSNMGPVIMSRGSVSRPVGSDALMAHYETPLSGDSASTDALSTTADCGATQPRSTLAVPSVAFQQRPTPDTRRAPVNNCSASPSGQVPKRGLYLMAPPISAMWAAGMVPPLGSLSAQTPKVPTAAANTTARFVESTNGTADYAVPPPHLANPDYPQSAAAQHVNSTRSPLQVPSTSGPPREHEIHAESVPVPAWHTIRPYAPPVSAWKKVHSEHDHPEEKGALRTWLENAAPGFVGYTGHSNASPDSPGKGTPYSSPVWSRVKPKDNEIPLVRNHE